MEYGASAEDIARVCHAHPVSFKDFTVHYVYVMKSGRGRGMWLISA